MRALVTGGSRGIGLAVVKELLDEGYQLVVITRHMEDQRKRTLLTEIGATEERVKFLACDLSDLAEVARTREILLENQMTEGAFSCTVMNAGIAFLASVVRFNQQDIQNVLTTNFTSVILLLQPILKCMKKGRYGRVVLVSSISTSTGAKAHALYGASKAALEGYCVSASLELAVSGVTINCVRPGLFNTDMTSEMGSIGRERVLSNMPIGRFGEPVEAAKLITFLCSESSSFVNGSIIPIDGGVTAF